MIIGLNPKYYIEYFSNLIFETTDVEILEKNIHKDSYKCDCIRLVVNLDLEKVDLDQITTNCKLKDVVKQKNKLEFTIDYKKLIRIIECQYCDVLPIYQHVRQLNFKSDDIIYLMIYKTYDDSKLRYQFIEKELHNFCKSNLKIIERSIVLKKKSLEWKFIGSGCNCHKIPLLDPDDISHNELLDEMLWYLDNKRKAS